jgi:hypothetical protein
VRPALAPSWWFYEVGDPAAAEVPVEDRRKKPRRGNGKRPPVAQELLPMFTPPAAPATPAAPAPAAAATESPLARSELFAARAPDPKLREQALRAVDFLRARRGVASAAAFASELGAFEARVGGVVARLQEVLNLDGYQVLRFDRQGQQVILDLEKLAQQFDVTL